MHVLFIAEENLELERRMAQVQAEQEDVLADSDGEATTKY